MSREERILDRVLRSARDDERRCARQYGHARAIERETGAILAAIERERDAVGRRSLTLPPTTIGYADTHRFLLLLGARGANARKHRAVAAAEVAARSAALTHASRRRAAVEILLRRRVQNRIRLSCARDERDRDEAAVRASLRPSVRW